jgi:hypothetical protein
MARTVVVALLFMLAAASKYTSVRRPRQQRA